MMFSIIIPIYNTRKYLSKCLNSIKHQYYTDFEVILINDGSTDGSEAICNQYAEEDVRFKVFHQKNSGQATARNNGIDRAEGEYILFVDSDDWIHINLLSYLHDVIKKNDPQLIIYAREMLSEWKAMHREDVIQNAVEEKILDQRKLWEEYLEKNRIGGWITNRCIKRTVLQEFNLRIPVIAVREDAYFTLKIFQYIDKTIISNFLGYYQILRFNSIEQKQFTVQRLISIDIEKEKMIYIQNNYPELYPASYYCFVSSLISSLTSIIAERKEKECYQEFQDIIKNLSENLDLLISMEGSEVLYQKVDLIVNHFIRWKFYCRIVGIKRKLYRVKRFLYAKIL